MRVTNFHRAGVHFINAILLINLLSAAFLPTYVMAQATVEEDEERIQEISKGQWDGALGVKSFTLPGIDTTTTTGHSYKQNDGTYDFSTIKMGDLFQGFSQAQHEAYSAELLDIQANPHKVQDAVYQMELDKTTYADTECETLATTDEQQRCELVKQASILDDMRNNPGTSEFMGVNDSILTDFASIADGTHPYYAELQNEECVELIREGEDGEDVGLTGRNVCIVAADVPEQVCKAERYLKSTKVGERTVVKYPIDPDPGIQILNSDFEAYAVRDCPNFDSTYRTCLELDVLSSTAIDRVTVASTSNQYVRSAIELLPYRDLLMTDDVRLRSYTVRSDHLAPNMTLSGNLGLFIDNPTDYVTDASSNLRSFESGYYYGIQQQDDCNPQTYQESDCPNTEQFVTPFSPNGKYGTAHDNADMFRISLSDSQLQLSNPPHVISGIREEYTISPVQAPRIDQGFDNSQPGFTVSGETGTYDPGDNTWDHIDTIRVHGYYPKNIRVTDHVEFPSDDLKYYHFNRMQMVFNGKVSAETNTPPDPVDDSKTTIVKVLIDDLSTYPRKESISILGAAVDAEISVFDQGTYGLSDYFPTNLRVVGESVVNYTVKTIGRPTNRYQYEIEIEFDAIAPFEVIADIHVIDEQGFRPRSDEDPNCQAVIDLYTTGQVQGTAVCDYAIGNGDGSYRVSDDGVPIDWPHVGYFGFMPDWTPDGQHALPNFCYDATINVDPSDFGGFASLDRELACSGLDQADYDACMNGQYCEYSAVTGEMTCQNIGEDLKSTFEQSCAAYINDESCEHKPNETRCEESIERDGQTICLYESHVFECATETEYSGIGSKDESEIDCGTPRNCIYGECSNIAEESNDAFLRATAAMQVLQEAKDNKCVVDAGGLTDESSCRLFGGEPNRCKTPTVWGATDCCNPDELGMGSMNVVAYWQMAKLMDEMTERVDVAGYMGEAWGAVKSTVDGTAVGEGLGSMSEFITKFGSDAYSFMTKPIISGWESTFETLGFSPESEIVTAAADFFDMSGAVAQGANAATAATQESLNTMGNTSTSGSAGALDSVGDENAFGGVYEYIANGINDWMMENGYEEMAQSIFQTGSDGSIGFSTEAGSTGEFLGQMSNVFGYIMLAYTIYNMYNLAVGVAFACDEGDFETTQKVKLLSTHYVGSWCSKKLFIGGCVEHSQAHCVYPSVFSRIISEQFRRIMAEDQGVNEQDLWLVDPDASVHPDNLSCIGFSLGQVTSIDWDRVDLSEYEEIVLATLKYDPNNMPEDFVKSEYMVSATGPQAGQTIKDSGAAQAAIVGYGSEQIRDQLNVNDMTLPDPDYMPWFDHGSAPDGQQCLLSCDTANNFYYSSASGLCVSTEKVPYPATFNCDASNGYTLVEETSNNFVCRKAQTIPLTTGCRQGFILDEQTGLCTKDTTWFEPKIASCPTGYRLSALQDSCELVQTTPKVTNCTAYGPEFVLIDNVCQQVNTETAPPFFSCASSDYIVEDGDCVLRTVLPPALGCQAPLEYDRVSGTCVEVSYQSMPATFSCDAYGEGYVLSYGQCVKRTVTAGTLSCNTGFSLVDGVCQQITTGVFDASTTCPDGYIADPNDTSKCFKRAQTAHRADPYCEDSTYTLVDNLYCEKVISETLPATPTCLNGYHYDDASSLCVRVTRYPPTINCPATNMQYDATVGLCRSITHETTPATLTCNDGDVLDGINCTSTEAAGYSISCPEDYFYNAETDSCILQNLDRKTPSYWCPIGTSREGNRCFQYDYVEPSRSCESPKVLNTVTNMCEETIVISEPPMSLCPVPSYRDYSTGLCMVDETIPADIACPNVSDIPYTYNSVSGMCERNLVDEQLSVFICPPGDVECNTADERQPVPQCANGSVNEVTGRCDDYAFTYPDAIAFCDNENHFYNASTNRCEYMETMNAIKCGPPLSPYFFYDSVSETCKHQNTVSQIADCVAGFTFDGTNCVRTLHAPMTCSDPSMTFDLALDRCVKTTVVPAVVACQAPYVVDPDNSSQCRLPPTHVPICNDEYVPVGYDNASDRCRHLGANTQHPAYLVCPPGSINQDNTHCYSGNTSSTTCPIDYSYNSATERCEFTPTQTWYCTGDTVLATDPVSGDLKCMYKEERRPICPSPDQYYDIAQNRCIIEDIVTGTMVCNDEPPFYRHLDGTQCMTVARVPYDAPDVCPDGYYPADPTYCEAQVTAQPPEFNCPAGYERNMADPVDTESPRCVRYVDSTPECDLGFTLVGNLCEQEHYDYDPIESCLYQGQTLFGSACTSGQQDVAPVCPTGYFYSSDYDICIELTEVSYTQSCLSTNFVLDAATGMCNSVYDEAPTCLTGYTLNTATNLCEQIYMPPVCDEANGFYYDTALDVCRKYETQPANFFCDPGERDDGDGCTPVQAPTCNDGWVFEPENDRCYRQENQPHEPNCESPYVDYGGECVLQQAVDCSIYSGGYWDAATETCNDPQTIPAIAEPCSGPNEVLIGDNCYETEAPQCPAYAPNYNPATDLCEGTGTTSAYIHCDTNEFDTGTGCTTRTLPTCSAGFVFEAANDRCYRVDTQPHEPNCGPGEIDFGGECIEEVPVDCSHYGQGAYWDPASQKCMVPDSQAAIPNGCGPNEILIGDTCYHTESPQCPSNAPNYNPLTKKCEGTSTYAGTPYCNDGDFDTGSGCTPQAPPTCSSGYVFNASADICQKTESFAKGYECSAGSLNGTNCVETAPVNCPAGYADPDNDGVCTKRTASPAQHLCDNGETPPNCEQVTEYIASCPSGYTNYDNTTCSKTTETSSVPSCPSGLTYQHATNDCRDLSATSPAESCPGGDTDGNPSNGCTSVDNDSGRITCSGGYNYNPSSKQCERTDYASKTCASGTLQSDGTCLTNHGYVEECDDDKYSPANTGDSAENCFYLWSGFNSSQASTFEALGFSCSVDAEFASPFYLCSKIEPKELVCHYDEVDGQCIENHGSASCPGGYVSSSATQCSRLTTQTPTCSGGYTWTGSTCSNTYDNGSYTQTCPSGEQLSGNQCYLPTTTYTCPSGHSLINNYAGSSNGDRCVQTTVDYQSKLCPSGGALQSDGQCRTVTYGNDYYQCSSGILEGTECAVYDDQPGCDVGNGFVYYSGSNDCRRVSGANLESCPSGWTDNGSSCSRVLTEPPACNDGYYYEASTNLCHLTVPTDYYYNCGSDSYIGNGQCSASTSITPSCSSGYTFYGSSDHCRQNTGTPQTYSCPTASPSYTLNGQMCNREVPNAPYCPTGTFNAVKGTCTFNHHPYNPNCNSPFVDANGQCEQYFIDPPGCAAGEYYNNTSKMCELVTETDYIYECYDNATQVYTGNGLCTFDTSSSATCNQGFTLDSSGNYCLEDSGTQRPYSCPVATPSYTLNMGDMTCNRIVQNPPNCVNGNYDSALGTCVYGQKPHTPNCYSPYVDANGQCELYLPEPPICSPGYPTFNPTHDTCDAAKESYNYVCDAANGFTPIAGDITMCEKTTLASSTCPVSGQVLDTTDDMCKTYSYSAKTDQCNSLGYGSVRTGANCQTYYGQGYVTCDPGYRVDYDVTRNHLVCHNAQTQVTTTFCPFGYTADGGSCVDVATSDVDYSCEPGWALEWTGTAFECQQFTGDVYPNYECLNPSSPLYDSEACRAQSVTDVGEVIYTCQGSGYVYNEEDHVCRLPADGYPVNEYCENPFYTLTPLTSDELTDDGRLYKCVYHYVDTVPADLSCPDAQPPYELRATGNCVRSEPTDSVVACNPGYVLNNDGTACTRNVVQESMPDITCPEPYEATYTGECLVTTVTAASQTCDPAEPTTNNCAMQLDSSTGVDQYGEFASAVSISAGVPFEVSMTIACLEAGQACVLLGSSSATGDAVYINATGNSIIIDDNSTVSIFALPPAVDITMLNRYHIARDFDNEVTVSVNALDLGSQVVPGAFVFERTFKHAGLGEHSMVNFSSAAIANYSTLPQQGHVYKPSCTAPSNLLPDLNLDNDITISNTGSYGGPVSSYSGTNYKDNVPPIPIYDSEWDLVNGVCEKLEIIDDIPPTLTCNGELDTNGDCIEAVSYPATPTCDLTDGWQYNSLTFVCERTVIVEQPPASYSCADSSHVLVDGLCQYSDGILPVGEGCNEGYEYNSVTSSCAIYLVLTDEAVLCEDGDEQRYNVCFERQYITPDPACPANTVDIGGGQCQGTVTVTEPADVYCSSGEIVGPNCVETDSQPASISCSDTSYELLNNICFKDIIASSVAPSETCLPGHTLSVDDGLCHFENIVTAQVECPDIEYSFNSTTELCERVNVQNYRPDLGCPDDGQAWVSVSGTRCELVTNSIVVTRTCEDPTADDSGEQCRFEAEETHAPDFCATPYEYIDGQCVFYEYERPEIICPEADNIQKTANGCMEIRKTTQVPTTSC